MILSIVSLIASITSIFSLVPQIIQTYRTKSAKDLSLLMLINILVCSLSWIAYGYLTSVYFICVTNGIMAVFSIILISFKVFFSKVQKIQHMHNNFSDTPR